MSSTTLSAVAPATKAPAAPRKTEHLHAALHRRRDHFVGLGIRRARFRAVLCRQAEHRCDGDTRRSGRSGISGRHRQYARRRRRGADGSAGVRRHHRPDDGPQPGVRARLPPLRQRLLRHADDRGAAAVLALVRLFIRHPDRHHHLCRDLFDHHQCRRWRPFGAARISRSRALVSRPIASTCCSASCCRPRCPICWPASGWPQGAP